MTKKIERDAFIYMDPHGSGKDFAQCSTCREFMPHRSRCAVMDVAVHPDASCGLYFYGTPTFGHEARKSTTPKETGLIRAQVRCENCVSFDGTSGCKLFAGLNKEQPELWDLDEKVKPKGCCNAWRSKK